MFGNLVRAEVLRVRHSRNFALLAAIGAFLIALSIIGSASTEHKKLLAHTTTVANASFFLLGTAFLMVLFASLHGILQVTAEFKARSMGLLAIVAPARTPILWAKAAVSALVGAALGVLSCLLALGVSAFALQRNGAHLVVGGHGLSMLVLTVAVCAVGGPWGVFVGTIVRSQLWAVLAMVVYTTMIEAAALHLLPSIGRWLPGGAEAAILSDPSDPRRLGVIAGALLLVAWVAIAGGVAASTFRTHDI